jgi:hypothetical protein
VLSVLWMPILVQELLLPNAEQTCTGTAWKHYEDTYYRLRWSNRGPETIEARRLGVEYPHMRTSVQMAW